MRIRIIALLAPFSALALAATCSAQTASLSPRAYATALAGGGVPSGLVVPDEAVTAAKEEQPGDQSTRSTVVSKELLRSSVAAFNASQAGYRAVERQGVVHVRSVREPQEIKAALERGTRTGGADDIPALVAVYRLVLPAISDVEPQGYAGSGALPDPTCQLERPVRIPAGETSPIQLLDQIVRQVPGLTWLVTYRPEAQHQDLKVGLMCPSGFFLRISVY